MPGQLEPYGRDEFRNALIVNAAAKPLNLLVPVVVMGAGIALTGQVLVCVVLALVLYVAACARTFFDAEEADQVLARERADRRRRLGSSTRRLDLDLLAPRIRVHLFDARTRERRIREAIERAELPYAEVSDEVDRFVRVLEHTAGRAQLLHEALEDTPVAGISARLSELRARRGGRAPELQEALERQLHVHRRMEAQLKRFYDEMERINIELDTVRASLVSASAATDADAQRELAEEVAALRERVGAVAEAISEVYEQPT